MTGAGHAVISTLAVAFAIWLGKPAALSQNAEPQSGVGLGRVERVRLADIGERLGGRARQIVGKAAREENLGVLGIELKCPVVIGKGAVEFAFAAIGPAAILIGERRFRIDPERLGISGNRAVEIAGVAIRRSAIDIRRGVVRRQPDRLGKIGDGPLEIPFRLMAASAQGERPGRLGLQPDDLCEIADRAVVVLL